MIKFANLLVALAGITFASAARAQVRLAPTTRSSQAAPPSVVALKCIVQGAAAPALLGKDAGRGRMSSQKIMVQNTGGAPLLNGEIDFTVSLASASGFERAIAKVPTSLGPGETVQVADADMATACKATFIRSRRPAPA